MNLKDLRGLDREDVLDLLGLETKRRAGDYLVPGLLVFGAGLAVGAGLGMLLAPRPGAELRGQLGQAWNRGLEQGRQQVSQVREKLQGEGTPHPS